MSIHNIGFAMYILTNLRQPSSSIDIAKTILDRSLHTESEIRRSKNDNNRVHRQQTYFGLPCAHGGGGGGQRYAITCGVYDIPSHIACGAVRLDECGETRERPKKVKEEKSRGSGGGCCLAAQRARRGAREPGARRPRRRRRRQRRLDNIVTAWTHTPSRPAR